MSPENPGLVANGWRLRYPEARQNCSLEAKQVQASPPRSEFAVDAALRYLGEEMALFDPLRFRAWAELGLTTAQLRVMFLMRQQPGVTAGELATRLAVTPPTISGIVDRLVKLALVRREDDESDRRLVRNHLSEKGEVACSRLMRGAETFTRRILVEMSEADLEAFVQGLRAFITASELVSRVEPNLAEVAMPGTRGQ
jgi:DNA-binding MarR family transcriptional regulator